MDLKKKLKRFFTLTHKADDGFTLVELIVVIAILAILAGVGSVGYAGYIKSANKGNDKVLVGEIMRAVEMGTYSTMFTNNDSFKMGSISYPVGFIALDTNGAEVVVSNTTKTEGVGGCEFVTVQVTKLTSNSVKKTCGLASNTKDVYTITNESVTYCKIHGSEPTALGTDIAYITEFNGCTSSGFSHSHNWDANTKTTTLPAGTLIADGSVMLQSSDASLCEYAYANQYGGFSGTSSVGNATTGNALYDSLTAAFGDVSTLKLSYDGWGSDGSSINYATFYTSAPKLMENMESLTNLLVMGDGLADIAGVDLGLKGDYENGEEVLAGVSDTIAATYTEDEWMSQWNGVATNGTWDSYGFGLEGRETYCAARMAYNNAFASYVAIADPSLSSYSGTLEKFYSDEMFGVGLPGLICTDAFTDSDSPLKEKINNDEAFGKIAALYETYKNSPACTENGKLVYDTMTTFNETSDVASDSNNAYGGDMFDYYNSYVNEISALYNAAQNAAGDGIIIIVSVEDGLVKCDVSPMEANPRND